MPTRRIQSALVTIGAEGELAMRLNLQLPLTRAN